ncbi:CRISPR-associated endonuclease Cas2 [Heyndrickxia coagulans]|uniref:CRISPR-associated endonuclease Cas2 n=1 Tax=Heyndrickxia coagulans TaxID=1398 RepID=UPI0034A047EB
MPKINEIGKNLPTKVTKIYFMNNQLHLEIHTWENYLLPMFVRFSSRIQVYDINERRVQKVFKICKKYLYHHQKSVFRGAITPSQLISLKKELNKVIHKDEDFISIVKFLSEFYFDEETIGKNPGDGESIFL